MARTYPTKPLTRLILLTLAGIVLGIGGLLTWMERRAAVKAMHGTMLAQALMLSVTFDLDKLASLTGTLEDLACTAHHDLRGQLIRIRNANPGYRYLYLMNRRNGQSPFFLMGTAPEGSADYSPPGQIYFEDSPTLAKVFANRTPELSPPFTDRWGTWISALVPITDPSSGNLLAVFGMDMDAAEWQHEVLRRSLMPAVATLCVLVLMIAGTEYLRRRQLAVHVAALGQAEAASRQNETLFRLQFELGNIGIAITSPAKGWLHANARLCQMLGYTQEQLRGKNWAEMTHPQDLAADLESFEQMLAGRIDGYEMDKRFYRKDGSLLDAHLTVSCHRHPDGSVEFIIASLQDISDRRLAEKALQESEDRFRSMIQSASDMILVIGTDGVLSYESPSVARILGYPEGFFLGQTPFALIHPDDLEVVNQQMALVYRSANPGTPTEFRLKTPDGNWIWLEALASNQNDNPAIRGIIITARDISERKRAELDKEALNAQLLQAQKMEAVGHLAGGIAHDFNNMLSVVIGHAEMALNGPDTDSALRKRFKTIHEAASRSADLVRQLLAYARKQTISPKVLDINTTIAGMLNMLQRLIGEDIDLAWAPGQGIGQVRIDPSQLDQILANLMVNARDAIAGVGKVTIETANRRLDDAYCGDHVYCTPGDYVMLAVSDSGCGMDAHTLSRIFDPFFTTKGMGKGTGLGLATVYGIVKQNDGFINVYSEPGQGTTFRIYLPRVDAPLSDQPPEPADDAARGGSGTILIVEDDVAILDLGKSILNQFGYTVLTAATPARALDLAREQAGRIDLVITDVVMPQMNGRDLVRQLAAIVPGLKCLFMSGYTANVIAHHGVLDEGVHFLQKPFSVKELTDKVAQALGR